MCAEYKLNIYICCLQYNRIPNQIGQLHVFLDELILSGRIGLSGDHIADRFVKSVHLMWLEIANDRVYVV